jgi:uncharacterized protein with von Willebrand factor type A (vWA) domain
VDALILKFFRAARGAGIRISPAEGIDAANAVAAVGFGSRQTLRDTLLLTVAKTEDEKKALAECFDLFFRRDEQFGAEDEADGEESSDDQDGQEQGEEQGQGESEGQGQSQGQGRGQEPGQDEAQRPAAAQNQDLGALARMLLANDRSALAQAMNAAADAVNLQEIQFFTQRGIYSNRILQQMGTARLQRDIATLTTTSDPRTQRLMNARDALREAVRDMVNRAILLYTREGTENLRNEILRNTALNNLERRDVERTRTLVRTIARRLRDRYSKPRKRKNRGRLDTRKTIRRNASWGGIPFVTVWKQKKIDKPRIVALCDVSGSVARVVEFLLLFLYSLSEAVQDIRTFAFAGNLIEVSDKLNENHIEDAMKEVLKEIGFGSSDYGQSLVDFEENFIDSITNRTTVIILGDGRTNNLDPRTDILRRISERAKRVIWLNPEARFSWGVGDSEMPRYEPYCTLARPCGTVMQLERVVSDIMAMDRH